MDYNHNFVHPLVRSQNILVRIQILVPIKCRRVSLFFLLSLFCFVLSVRGLENLYSLMYALQMTCFFAVIVLTRGINKLTKDFSGLSACSGAAFGLF